VLMDRKRPAEAARELELAAALAPKDAAPWMALGAARRTTGDLPGAIAAYQNATRSDPRRFDAWFDLATAQHDLGHDAEALESLRQARERPAKLEPIEMADWHYGMGTVLLAMAGQEQAAATHLREALALNPDADQAAEVREVLKSLGDAPRKP